MCFSNEEKSVYWIDICISISPFTHEEISEQH